MSALSFCFSPFTLAPYVRQHSRNCISHLCQFAMKFMLTAPFYVKLKLLLFTAYLKEGLMVILLNVKILNKDLNKPECLDPLKIHFLG